MNFITQPVGAIIAATVAAFAAFLISILSKDQKISEFRLQWIEGLRDDIADFIGVLTTTVLVIKVQRSQGLKPSVQPEASSITKLTTLASHIQLSLNPKEHVELDALISTFLSDATVWKDDKKLEQFFTDLTQTARPILKSEWKRVKRGEPTVFAVRWISFIVFVVSCLLALFVAWQNYVIPDIRAMRGDPASFPPHDAPNNLNRPNQATHLPIQKGNPP